MADEKQVGIRLALEEYVCKHGKEKAWVQDVVLAEMLDGLLWSRP